MPQRTNIEWTNFTSNPIAPAGGGWGCSKVSPGCDNCYAETLNKRFGNRRNFNGKWEFALNEKELAAWTRLPPGSKVFVMDMGDMFHRDIPWDMVSRVFAAMAARHDLIFQVLTKRPGRMMYFAEYIWEPYTMEQNLSSHVWPSNVWAGTSVETQKYAPRLDCLARVPARVRFVSAEPLLGPLDISPWLSGLRGDRYPPVHWVICGGESGGGARPMDIAWARDLRNQCQGAGVPFFMKQLGTRPVDSGYELGRFAPEDKRSMSAARDLGQEVPLFNLVLLRDRKGGDPAEWPEDLRVREMPNV